MESMRTVWKLPPILQPRLTWRYCVASAAVAYVVYCLLSSSPFFSSNLPPYTGPHNVGAIDIEVPVRDPRLVHDAVFRDSGEPAFKLDTVLFTLYYPAAPKAKSKIGHHYWVPKPLWLTAVGYAKFAHISNFLTNNLFTGVMGLLVGGTEIPAQVDIPLISEKDSLFQTRSAGSSYSEEELGSHLETTADGHPIIIFSHGFASSRTQYTYYLGELASRGYICAAIEHRDGSGPGTQIISSSSPTISPIDRLHFGLDDMETSPHSPDPNHQISGDEFKAIQLAFREAEILETAHIVQSLNTAGGGAKILTANSRLEGTGAGLATDVWVDRLNLNATILAGHSFGATGAMQGLSRKISTPGTGTSGQEDAARNPFAGGVMLDPGKSSGRLNSNIDVPILIIHSTSWSAKRSNFYGRPHFDTVRDIARHLNGRGVAAWFMTSIGTSHPSVTDAPLIEPLLLRWTTGAKIDVREGVLQYVHASDDFGRFIQTGRKRNLLAEEANSPDEYDKRKVGKGLSKKWMKYWQVHVTPVG